MLGQFADLRFRGLGEKAEVFLKGGAGLIPPINTMNLTITFTPTARGILRKN